MQSIKHVRHVTGCRSSRRRFMRQPNPPGTIPSLLPSINIYQSSRFLYLASVRCRIPVDTRIDSFHALRRLVSALKTGLGPDSRYQRAAITSQNVRALQSRHVEAFNSGLSHTIPAILCPYWVYYGILLGMKHRCNNGTLASFGHV